MSLYTTELRYLVEAGYDLGLRDYPIYDEKYRGRLNQKILDHYRFHEIGAETPERFVHYLNTAMRENMPYYNDLYRTAALILDPLKNRNLARSVNSEGETTNAQESTDAKTATQTADMLQVGSDTPASLLSAADIKSNLYASRAERQDNTVGSTEEGTAGTSGSSTNSQDTVESVSGLDGMTQSAAILEYRNTLLNIDMLVIESLATCFMGVY